MIKLVVGSNNASIKLTRRLIWTVWSTMRLKSAVSSASCPNVLMTLMPLTLSWVLSFNREKAACDSENAACNRVPSLRAITANNGIGKMAINVKRQSTTKIMAIIVVPPVINESNKVKMPAPATFWTAFKSLVACAIKSPVRCFW